MTAEQLDVMFTFLEQHPQLARGRLRDLDGRVKASRLWQELADSLNSMGGNMKTVKQWQRVWTDKKYNTKKVVSEGRRHAEGTGGGPPLDTELTTNEKRVLVIMGPAFGKAVSNARVPAFPESGTNRRPVEGGHNPCSSRPAPNSTSARPARSLHSSRPEGSPLDSSPDRSPLRLDRSPLRLDLSPPRSPLRPDCSPDASRPECSAQVQQSIQVTPSPGVTGGLTEARTPSRREQAPAHQNARGRGRQWRPPRTLLARTSALATSSSGSISSRLFRLEEERVRAETERAKELREIREAVFALNETMRDFLHAFVESTASRANE